MTSRTNCPCVQGSQINDAYLVDNISVIPDKDQRISLATYIKSEDLKTQVRNKAKYLVCSEGKEIILVRASVLSSKKPYFRHKSTMSPWHMNFQSHFACCEIPFDCSRRADIVEGNIVIELQHSPIKKDEVNARNRDYISYGFDNVLWIVDGNETILLESISSDTLLTFKHKWMFSSFMNCEKLYISLSNYIYTINPKDVTDNCVKALKQLEKDFILDLKNEESKQSLRLQSCHPQSVIKLIQRGPGNGKTYEAIELINADDLSYKDVFIYLTKQHSAVTVLKEELVKHIKNGTLKSIDETRADEVHTPNNKQYKIKFESQGRNREVIIGTVDSFMYALNSNGRIPGGDYFEGLVKSISDGNLCGDIKYAQTKITLSQKSIVIVDETQDLNENYANALCSIANKTHIDIYAIGDLLQSIWFESNAFSLLMKSSTIKGIQIDKTSTPAKNIVRRFHNSQFPSILNRIIRFKQFGLPEISGICPGDCGYKHDDIYPVKTFKCSDRDDQDIEITIDHILTGVNESINLYNCDPEDFLFLFPVMTGNRLAKRLEVALHQLWIKRFDSIQNLDQIKSQYWRTELKTQSDHKFCFLHTSDDNQPIDLEESLNASRIQSIHSAKGSGRPVVFLLKFFEKELTKFDTELGCLKYESLVNVALTRQMQMLYIGLNDEQDDIRNRCEEIFKVYDPLKIKRCPNYKFTPKDLVEYISPNRERSDSLLQLTTPYEDFEHVQIEDNNSKINMNWEHHTLRFSIFQYYLLSKIGNEDNQINNRSSQLHTILDKITELTPTGYDHKQYFKVLKEYSNVIPLLQFGAQNRHTEQLYIVSRYIKHIQDKIKNRKPYLPDLCPLETIIFLHMVEINSFYFKMSGYISTMDVYRIIQYWKRGFKNHTVEYNCLCKTEFKECYTDTDTGNRSKLIIDNYMKIERGNSLYKQYKDKCLALCGNNLMYNISHNVNYSDDFFSMETARHLFMGYSDTCIIIPIIKPSLSQINYSQVMIEAIFTAFIMLNIKRCLCLCPKDCKKCKDYDKYGNKDKVYICLFSLEHSDVLVQCLTKDDINSIDLKADIKSYMLDTYLGFHSTVFKWYTEIRNSSDHETVIQTLRNRFDDKYKGNDKLRVPKYIYKFFDSECVNIDSSSDDNSNTFFNRLDTFAKKRIELFLK